MVEEQEVAPGKWNKMPLTGVPVLVVWIRAVIRGPGGKWYWMVTVVNCPALIQ